MGLSGESPQCLYHPCLISVSGIPRAEIFQEVEGPWKSLNKEIGFLEQSPLVFLPSGQREYHRNTPLLSHQAYLQFSQCLRLNKPMLEALEYTFHPEGLDVNLSSINCGFQ